MMATVEFALCVIAFATWYRSDSQVDGSQEPKGAVIPQKEGQVQLQVISVAKA